MSHPIQSDQVLSLRGACKWEWKAGKKKKKNIKKTVDLRVGDVKAGQVVRCVAEEMKQSVSGRCDHLWYGLVAPGFRHY